MCGDFNVARASPLHRELRRRSGLRDAFDGECPPTFHAEYLAPGSTAHCIDFILVAEPIGVDDTDLLLTGKRTLPSGPGHLSDHIGPLAQLQIPRPARLATKRGRTATS